MQIVNDFSELPGAGSGSEVGKGVTFQTIAAEQAVGCMAVFNEPVDNMVGTHFKDEED